MGELLGAERSGNLWEGMAKTSPGIKKDSLQECVSVKTLGGGWQSTNTKKTRMATPFQCGSVARCFGSLAVHLNTRGHCLIVDSNSATWGPPRLSMSIQLPGNAPDPWETMGESIQEVRYLLTFWRVQFPLALVSQSIEWVSDYSQIVRSWKGGRILGWILEEFR